MTRPSSDTISGGATPVFPEQTARAGRRKKCAAACSRQCQGRRATGVRAGTWPVWARAKSAARPSGSLRSAARISARQRKVLPLTGRAEEKFHAQIWLFSGKRRGAKEFVFGGFEDYGGEKVDDEDDDDEEKEVCAAMVRLWENTQPGRWNGLGTMGQSRSSVLPDDRGWRRGSWQACRGAENDSFVFGDALSCAAS